MNRIAIAFVAAALILSYACGDDNGSGGEPDGDMPVYIQGTDGDLTEEGEIEVDFTDEDNENDYPDGDSEFSEYVSSDSDSFDEEKTDGDIVEEETADGDMFDIETEVSDSTSPDGDESSDTCGFSYNFDYDSKGEALSRFPGPSVDHPFGGPDLIAHAEPKPDGTSILSIGGGSRTSADIVLPGYTDTMPLFERAAEWSEGETRCYELPDGAAMLSEEEAFDLYAGIVSETLWYNLNTANGRRSVIGLRGTYPGTFEWHGNLPDRFNDTLALLWIEGGQKRVLEFPVNTDTGAHEFGIDSSSSLWPNRHYAYDNGWHSSYNAMQINEWNYMVRDDANANGHWDSDRNGWLPPFDEEDRDREGGSHNIHVASVDAPLSGAEIDSWSAGCQTIAGMENWLAFISSAWTQEGDPLDYYLIDARDIAPSVWSPCDSPDGTHACPYPIETFPFEHQDNTAQSVEDSYDLYNCSDANESGPEVIYVMNLHNGGTLNITVQTDDDEQYDPDIHLLMGDDPDACRVRAHTELNEWIPPGRYIIIVDTWVDEAGMVKAGPYQLRIDLE